MTGTRRAVVALAAAAVLSGAVALAAVTRDRSTADARRETSFAAFGILRKGRTQQDEVPAQHSGKIRADEDTRRAGVRWDESRYATTRHGIAVYVVPARHDICMVLASAAIGAQLTCAFPRDAALGRLIARLVVDDSTIVAGLVGSLVVGMPALSPDQSSAQTQQSQASEGR
jgi:putative Ca2+/H+ antiporter (TMEM165/GDT1 family)